MKKKPKKKLYCKYCGLLLIPPKRSYCNYEHMYNYLNGTGKAYNPFKSSNKRRN